MKAEQGNGNDEREFLHDLSTPIGTALLLTDSLLDDVQNRANVDPDDLMRLSEIYNALEKITNSLKNRREVLVLRGVPSARA